MFVVQLTVVLQILQTANLDKRSDDKGLEVESLTLATVCGKTFMFLGAERTSTIFVFDITDPTSPVLHSHISAAGNTDMTPQEAFDITPEPRPNFNQGQIDPEMMSFDVKRRLLIVSGAFSGTLGVYKVTGLPECVELELTDNMKLPSAYDNNVFSRDPAAHTFELGANVGEKHAIMDNFIFVVGETELLQVIDTKDHATAKSKIVDMFHIENPGTDVTTCKTGGERLVAVATTGTAGKQDPGIVHLFTVGLDGKLTHKRNWTTAEGRLPDQIQWTKDCRTIIAACEGEAVPMTEGGTHYLGEHRRLPAACPPRIMCVCVWHLARKCVQVYAALAVPNL